MGGELAGSSFHVAPCLRVPDSLHYSPHSSRYLAEGAVDGVRFERLKGGGHHYPVLLHIGSTYVPVTESTLKELKANASLTGERFLDVLLEKVGYSDYLKDRIREELKKSGDPVNQAKLLQGMVRDL
jgi:hypothetical protein